MTEFACNPSDYKQLPWVADCDQCRTLLNAGEPGLMTWMLAAARHFEDEHQIVLVGA